MVSNGIALAIAALLGYLIGAFPTAYLLGRAAGIDIFGCGSGNMGAHNIYHTLGIVPAGLVWGIDTAKGVLAVLVASHLAAADPVAASALGGVAVVSGHIWSIWVWLLTGQLRGGKGASTAAGTWLMIAPLSIFAATIGLWGLVVGLSGYVPLATLIAFTIGTLWMLGLAAAGQIAPIAVFYALGVMLIVCGRHVENIRALLAGRERRLKPGLTKRAIASGGAAALTIVILSACVPRPDTARPLPTVMILPVDLTATAVLPPTWTPMPTASPFPTPLPTVTDTLAPTLSAADAATVCTAFKLVGAPANKAAIAYDGSATFTWSGLPAGTALTITITLHNARAGLRLDDSQPGDDSVAVPLLQLPQDGQYDWKLWLHPDTSASANATATFDPAATQAADSESQQLCVQTGTFTRLPLVMM